MIHEAVPSPAITSHGTLYFKADLSRLVETPARLSTWSTLLDAGRRLSTPPLTWPARPPTTAPADAFARVSAEVSLIRDDSHQLPSMRSIKDELAN